MQPLLAEVPPKFGQHWTPPLALRRPPWAISRQMFQYMFCSSWPRSTALAAKGFYEGAVQEEQDCPTAGLQPGRTSPQLGTALKGPEMMPREPSQGSRARGPGSAQGRPRALAELKWHTWASQGRLVWEIKACGCLQGPTVPGGQVSSNCMSRHHD